MAKETSEIRAVTPENGAPAPMGEKASPLYNIRLHPRGELKELENLFEGIGEVGRYKEFEEEYKKAMQEGRDQDAIEITGRLGVMLHRQVEKLPVAEEIKGLFKRAKAESEKFKDLWRKEFGDDVDSQLRLRGMVREGENKESSFETSSMIYESLGRAADLLVMAKYKMDQEYYDRALDSFVGLQKHIAEVKVLLDRWEAAGECSRNSEGTLEMNLEYKLRDPQENAKLGPLINELTPLIDEMETEGEKIWCRLATEFFKSRSGMKMKKIIDVDQK